MKLNLGCGRDIRKGYLNLDFLKGEGVDVVHDLNKFPYPFDSDSFDEIILNHVFEHLDYPFLVLKELYRITKNKGVIKITVPHFRSTNAWAALSHKRAFSSGSFREFDIDEDVSSLESQLLKIRREEVKIILPKFFRSLGIERIINLNNYLQKVYESLFSGIILPNSIYFKLRVIK